ncbi:dihydrofolate reductase family protein [uncultured Chitinophaga sp.]|uniref:dihydrofolate reductase family protein n=1 Tax=uncultured Chitinophaga sp. TaxID=339340 RepID=UPI0025D8C232|nr:dihydrofolate reductase family protein [uncultured Chitinophaga sp.]
MRKIIVHNFVTMDGVIQSPGSAHEDPENFQWGGWSGPHWDDQMAAKMGKITASPYDLLLGRRTYEIFAGYWPHQKDNPTTETFNRITKYVVSDSDPDISWQHSVLMTGDVVEAIRELKASEGSDLLVYGSSNFVQTLLENGLVDVMHNWIFPVTIGEGKKLFGEGTQPAQWKLTEVEVSGTGVIMAAYVPDGEIKTGEMSPD